MTISSKNLWDKFWKDKDGRVAVWQKPNLPLWVWIVSTILSKALPYGQISSAAAVISFGSLFTWAWLEIFQGANYFRRLLGITVLIAAVAARL